MPQNCGFRGFSTVSTEYLKISGFQNSTIIAVSVSLGRFARTTRYGHCERKGRVSANPAFPPDFLQTQIRLCKNGFIQFLVA